MPSVADLLTTTILMPTGDSLTSGNDLKKTSIDTDLSTYYTKNPAPVYDNEFEVSITSYASSSGSSKTKTRSYVGLCQEIRNLSVNRSAQSVHSGGSALYEVKVPDMVSYGEVTMKYLYTNSPAFLDWLFNGATEGGALLADIEIKIGDKTNGFGVFTLRDAFPIKWTLGDVLVIDVDEVTKRKTSSMGDGGIPLEEIVFVYSQLDFSKE